MNQLEDLYAGIHNCRKCQNVVASATPRKIVEVACQSGIVLMAQAPSEGGVRKSGAHWVGEGGKLRRPGGTFLDKFLYKVGCSVDPNRLSMPRPYTTNVLHCWPGRSGTRDRKPSTMELRNCTGWWVQELEIVRPRVLILLGQAPAEGFAVACGETLKFAEMLEQQGDMVHLGDQRIHRFALPHPTAPYPDKTKLYEEVFANIGQYLTNHSQTKASTGPK